MKPFQRMTTTALLLSGMVLMTNCATIVGGSMYVAKVSVPNHPNATIHYNGAMQGKGQASFLVKRREAHQLLIIIKEKGCEDQTSAFVQRSYRGGALVGTIIGWTGIINGIPIPWGIIVDSATGALWKPNVGEIGVSKEDYKHFNYAIEYKGCPTLDLNQNGVLSLKANKLLELKELYDRGALTQEEFEKEKKKLLEGE